MGRISRRRFLAWTGGTALAGGAYAFGIEPLWIETTAHELTLPGLPARFDGYVVAQLSDLHVGDGVPRWHLERAVAVANSFAPDLIVVTGDVVDKADETGAPDQAAAILDQAEAADGVYAVPGNHDTGAYYDGEPADTRAVPRLASVLAQAGVVMLDNETRTLCRGDDVLRIAGFGDLWSGDFDAGAFGQGACTLALSHNPDTAPDLAAKGADLILSGHTHGGQIRLPVFGPPWIPLKHKEYLRGHFHVGRAQLYVNRGLGWSRRVRFRARPEVSVFRLRSARDVAL